MTTLDLLSSLAEKHLPAPDAQRWLDLLRPSVRLHHADGSDQVVGQLGGLPPLPADVEWPQWDEHGPLQFIAAIDLAKLPVGTGIPGDGTLLFFFGAGEELPYEPVTVSEHAGAEIVYVPANSAAVERPAPDGAQVFPRVELIAEEELTAADGQHPVVHQAFAPAGASAGDTYDHPVCGRPFVRALDKLYDEEIGHRIGGYPDPIQGAVEYEAAYAALGEAGEELGGAAEGLSQEASEWVLLAQFDSDDDAEMMWGDTGAIYWLIRPADLAESRWDRVMVIGQSA